jgi:hypothetical protein
VPDSGFGPALLICMDLCFRGERLSPDFAVGDARPEAFAIGRMWQESR